MAVLLLPRYHYENLGICKEGEAGRMIDEGEVALGGRIPVNIWRPIVEGHPLGLWHRQHLQVSTHLRGEAGSRQVEGAGVTHVIGLAVPARFMCSKKPAKLGSKCGVSRRFIHSVNTVVNMRIGVVSDTHNNLKNVRRIVEF